MLDFICLPCMESADGLLGRLIKQAVPLRQMFLHHFRKHCATRIKRHGALNTPCHNMPPVSICTTCLMLSKIQNIENLNKHPHQYTRRRLQAKASEPYRHSKGKLQDAAAEVSTPCCTVWDAPLELLSPHYWSGKNKPHELKPSHI